MGDYPPMIAATDQVAPAPRRVRGVLGGRTVFDTVEALYVWESPKYPWYYVPLSAVDSEVLVEEGASQRTRFGVATRCGLRVGNVERPGAARVFAEDTDAAVAGTVRFRWDALDAWFEEDEQIYVHPRNPYTRVDALRSTRPVRVELDGELLAEAGASVMVFETGLPTRYYLDRSAADETRLVPTRTQTACPYKGITSRYWTARTSTGTYEDLAWSYDFPTRELLPIAGLIAFYNEKVDITLGGVALPRPRTHFFPS